MKSKLIMASVLLTLGACATGPARVDTVREEELSTDFVAEGLKVTSKNCGAIGKMFGRTCEIVAIESTSTAPSNGGTTNNRKNAMESACSYAMANVAHWMGERTQSFRTVERVGNSKELSESQETENSDRDVGRTESSNRQNSNDTNVVVTNTVRRSSERFLQGWQPVRQDVVGKQEVSCTMGWTRKNTDLMMQARGL
jgi:hypothetical protein